CECFTGLPSKLFLDEPAVNRVAEIVTESVGDRCKKVCILSAGARALLIEDRADLTRDVFVSPLASSSDEIRLSVHSASHHKIDRDTMIGDVKPVANVETLSVNRNRLLGQR